MTDHRRSDEGGPIAPRRTLAGSQQGQRANEPQESTQHWSQSGRTQTQEQPTQPRHTRPGARSASTADPAPDPAPDPAAETEKTSPLAMAAAAVAAAKDRMSSSSRQDDAETPPRRARSRSQDQVLAASSAVPGRTRRARLRLVRIDPWSVMKTAFLLSIAFGIMCVVAVFIIWSVLGAADVFTSVNQSVESVIDENFSIEDYIGMDRVLSFTMLVAVLDVVLLTAVATLGAFLYNLAASLLGGLEVTLAEDDR